MKFTQVGSECSLQDLRFSSKVNFKITDGLKASVSHKSGDPQAVAVTLTGKKWEVQHDFHKKDTRMKFKSKLGKANLTVKQLVPGNKWALVPNPVFELSRNGLMGEDSKLSCAYDCMDRVATAEQTIYAGEDKQHKAWIKMSSVGGPSAGMRSKLQKGPLLHSAAAAFSKKGGWQLSAKSKFSDGTKVKTTYSVDRQLLTLSAKHTPKREDKDAAKPTLTLAMAVPINQQKDPEVKLGLKWDL